MGASPSSLDGASGAPFDDLERAVRHLGEELAFFRRRALEAERRVRDLTGQVAAAGLSDSLAARERAYCSSRSAAPAARRPRRAAGAERTRALADRVRFVRQQMPDEPHALEEPT